MFAHRHRLKFCHSIICISFSGLSGAAHACLFRGLGAAVSLVIPKHWGQFYEVMANAVDDTATATAHYQISPLSKNTIALQISHLGSNVKCFVVFVVVVVFCKWLQREREILCLVYIAQ